MREALRQRRALCIEGAMIAAAALWVHGEPPLLLDLKAMRDYDHIVALYRRMADVAGGAPLVVVGSDPALAPLEADAPRILRLDPSAALAAPGPPAFYARDGHWTASGHRRVADALEPVLERVLAAKRR